MKRSRPSSPNPTLSEKELAILDKEVKNWGIPQKLEAFAKGSKRLKETLKRFPKGMWGFSTKRKNWNITQVLWHLADQEANLYVRLRRGVAEPGQSVSAYDQEKWDEALIYKKSDPIQARDLILLLRSANADLLRRVGPRAWSGVVKHQDWGTMTLENIVGTNIWHLEHHLAQMGRRHNEWKKR